MAEGELSPIRFALTNGTVPSPNSACTDNVLIVVQMNPEQIVSFLAISVPTVSAMRLNP